MKVEELKKKLKKEVEIYERRICKVQDRIEWMYDMGVEESNVSLSLLKARNKELWEEGNRYLELLRKVIREERRIKGEAKSLREEVERYYS